MKTATFKTISIVLSFIILFGCFFALSSNALAADYDSGDLGTGVSWSYDDSTGTLSLTGEGEIPAYQNKGDIPWWNYRYQIKQVSIHDGITRINSLEYLSEITSIKLPSSVTEIGSSAFYRCTKLETVDLPKNINYVNCSAFYECCSLKNITIAGDPNGHGNEFVGNGGGYVIRGSGRGYFVRDGVLFSNYDEYLSSDIKLIAGNHNRLELYPAGRSAESYVVPSDTKWIMAKAFTSPVNLKTVVIPASVDEFSDCAFRGLEEKHEKALNIVFQHNSYPFFIYSALHSLPEGSKLIVKNNQLMNEFKNNYDEFIYYFSGKEKEVEILVQPTPTTSLTLNHTNLSLKINENTVIEAVQTPFNTTDNIVFSSSDNSIVSFDKYGFGRLTAKGVGTAVITVTSGDVTTQCTVTVTCDHKSTYMKNICNATCSHTGYTGDKVCTVCGSIVAPGNVIPVTNHNFVETSLEPTCTTSGYTEVKCSICGFVKSANNSIPALGHNFATEWTIVENPTCTKDGVKKRSCFRCGQTETMAIEKLGHNFTTDYVINNDATCTQDATKTAKCDRCGLIDTVVIPNSAIGHTIVIDKAIPATCTETGLTKGKHCSACGEVLIKQKVVEKTSHNYIAKIIKQATCVTKGIKTYTCLYCGNSYSEDIAASGHTEVIDESIKPTCTKTGLTEGKHCSVCNVVLIKQKTLSATGHTIITDKAVPATCTELGLTEGKHCSVCNEVLVNPKIVNALGHKLITQNVIKADYFTHGYTGDEYCTVCKKVINKGVLVGRLTLKTPSVKYSTKNKRIYIKFTATDNLTGFQVRYKLKGAKTYSYKNFRTNKSVTKTLSGLKKGSYKIQIRAFLKKGSKTVYSDWTKTKTIKVK